jgi:general secretion pathway protein G
VNFASSGEKGRSIVQWKGSAARGFTLIEVVITIFIVGILAAIAIPNYLNYIKKADERTTISDIQFIEAKIKEIMAEGGPPPPDIASLNLGERLIDRWGHPYKYLVLYGLTTHQAKAAGCRKRKNLNPINTDFDLYSMGPDGETQENLKAAKGKDDIVRADEGAYIGIADDYEP